MYDWQTAIALMIVTGAAFTLCYRSWKTIFAKSPGSCGTGCQQCPSNMPHTANSPQLVQLGNQSPHSVD
ncbi:MAG: FeoB-associated Cys-rich membrane protein [Mariniblastus sp.]